MRVLSRFTLLGILATLAGTNAAQAMQTEQSNNPPAPTDSSKSGIIELAGLHAGIACDVAPGSDGFYDKVFAGSLSPRKISRSCNRVRSYAQKESQLTFAFCTGLLPALKLGCEQPSHNVLGQVQRAELFFGFLTAAIQADPFLSDALGLSAEINQRIDLLKKRLEALTPNSAKHGDNSENGEGDKDDREKLAKQLKVQIKELTESQFTFAGERAVQLDAKERRSVRISCAAGKEATVAQFKGSQLVNVSYAEKSYGDFRGTEKNACGATYTRSAASEAAPAQSVAIGEPAPAEAAAAKDAQAAMSAAKK